MLPLVVLFVATLCEVFGKTAIVTEWIGTGVRSVRKETVPNNLYNDKGEVTQDKTHPEKLPDGKTAYGCIDIVGKLRKHGEEYTRPNKNFKYACKNGTEEVIACINHKGANSSLIKIGETLLAEDGIWYKCEQNAKTHVTTYTEGPRCSTNGKNYKVGDDIYSGFLHMKCEENGFAIIGCYFVDKNNKKVDMKPGSSQQMNQTLYQCSNNQGSIVYTSTTAEVIPKRKRRRAPGDKCKKNGEIFEDGEEFRGNHLNYICNQGLISITS
ncbi:hypothetical protein AB6A40_007949 [Gnathostoma spinigerum]|uniref:Abnormal cell migration protein 18-like fibronectin type I domain-containing protein n=1 Tax=Gnathostoma spinigerum TaxID=75299 RepID=A0ABD6EYB0_9BILA